MAVRRKLVRMRCVYEEVEVHSRRRPETTVHAAKGWSGAISLLFQRSLTENFRISQPTLRPGRRTLLCSPSHCDDRKYLPQFDIADCGDKFEAGEAYLDFKRNQLTAYESQEARRLAYVAFTRPQAELLVAGYGLKNREEIKRLKEEGGAHRRPIHLS